MERVYGVVRWGNDPVFVKADEVTEDQGILFLKIDGKVVAEFKGYDAWWIKQNQKGLGAPGMVAG